MNFPSNGPLAIKVSGKGPQYFFQSLQITKFCLSVFTLKSMKDQSESTPVP